MRGRTSIERAVREVVARMAKLPEDRIDLGVWIPHYGIDSLGQLIVRETLERVLGVYFPDDVWLAFRSMHGLVAYAEERANGGEPAAAATHAGNGGPDPGPRLFPSGVLYDDVEIGMPHTGRNNLAEGPLLQYLAHVRLQHISAFSGVPSRETVDAEGNRLYPTVFFVEVAFPPASPMAAFGENDRFRVASTLAKFGDAMLDGMFFLLPPETPRTGQVPFPDLTAAIAAHVPAVRLSNIFARQFSGASWLKKSRPANPGFERVPELAVAPDCYAAVKQAEREGTFAAAAPQWVRLTSAPVRREYRLLPDRDLNGAGLVYFANYPVFLDICERDVLAGADLPLAGELIDRRTLVRRRSAYLNNAAAEDTLEIEIEPWIENPAASGHPAPELAPIRLFLTYRMRRRSDNALMMVSSAEKLVFGRAMEDLPFYAALAGRPAI
jgi:probable biosynthetic protein (TIGR04098 family)